jgi:GT2 family glycosyltransferase
MLPVTVFLPFSPEEYFLPTVSQFAESPLVQEVIIAHEGEFTASVKKSTGMKVRGWQSGAMWNALMKKVRTDYLLVIDEAQSITLNQAAIERFYAVTRDTRAGMLYSDYYEMNNGNRSDHPTIEYQLGSVRDNFDFGALMFFSMSAVRHALKKYGTIGHVQYAGSYDLRLKLSIDHTILHLQEYLYTKTESENRSSGEKQFDYVNPRNAQVQQEYEKVAAKHLKNIGAYLTPRYTKVPVSKDVFASEVSVIIPVRNRQKTIADAIKSVLSQQTTFPFNLIAVDNHSTDATASIVRSFAETDKRVHLLCPSREDLLIGGCWNEAVLSPECGRYAVQLDSDDMYSGPDTLQKIYDVFQKEKCAMVIGSYTLVNSNLEIISPGLIDHKEWTSANGQNNALRVNGLGAPRAFDTAILRTILLPNTSYGEDYAVALRISREYRIGRIYTSIYNCRRWEDNTDAALPLDKINRNDFYKDKIRTIEILGRIQKNKKG